MIMKDQTNTFTDDEVIKILRDSFISKVNENKESSPKFDISRAVISTLGEFLDCYKLLGYDLKGNPLTLSVYKNEMQKSALNQMYINNLEYSSKDD